MLAATKLATEPDIKNVISVPASFIDVNCGSTVKLVVLNPAEPVMLNERTAFLSKADKSWDWTVTFLILSNEELNSWLKLISL